MTDPRFVIQHAGDPEYSLITRINDGQLTVPGKHAEQDEGGHPARQ